MPAMPVLVEPQRTLVTTLAFAAWWTLVALAGMLRWRRVAATGACLGLAGQVVMLVVAGFIGLRLYERVLRGRGFEKTG